jgi:hypothetical protein
MPGENRPTASHLFRQGFGLALRPPFIWLIAVGILATLAASPVVEEDAVGLIGVFVLGFVSFYVSIAATLAAAEATPDGSPETWVREALARRCFVRSLVTVMFAGLLVFAGVLALIVPGFIIGAMVAIAQSAAILENHRPGDAIRRSIELSKPARRPIGLVYGLLVIVPTASTQILYYFVEIDPAWARGAIQAGSLVLSLVAQIAMTKAFLELGGEKKRRDAPPVAPERI